MSLLDVLLVGAEERKEVLEKLSPASPGSPTSFSTDTYSGEATKTLSSPASPASPEPAVLGEAGESHGESYPRVSLLQVTETTQQGEPGETGETLLASSTNFVSTKSHFRRRAQLCTHCEGLTLEDIPELKAQLEAQGWKVVQRGSELCCTPKNGLRIQ